MIQIRTMHDRKEKIMAYFSKEQKDRLAQAESIDDVRRILQEYQQDPSLAEPLWEEIVHFSQKLSTEELEAVTGGADRDYIKDGCAATVEAGSWCRSNDYCKAWSVTYDNEPTKLRCPDCGGILCQWDSAMYDRVQCRRYNCSQCGGFFHEDPLRKSRLIRIR